MTRRGLNRPKPMMTRVCKPPQKKKFQKKFSGSNFFFKKKNFAGLGVSVIMGFYLKPNPCHHGFWIQTQTAVSSWVSPKPPVSHPNARNPPPAPSVTPLSSPRSPDPPLAAHWNPL